MTITALDGPIVTFAEGTLPGATAGQNPESGPSLLHQSYAVLDARTPYTYLPGQDFGKKTYGLLSSRVVTLDQVPSTISAVNIAASQSPAGAGNLTLVSSTGAGITVGVSITNASTGVAVTGLLAIDGASGSVGYGQSATVQVWDPTKLIARNVRITSGGNDSGITFTVHGYDIYSYPMTETITGANVGVASGKKAFKYIASIAVSGASASTVTVGTGDVYGYPALASKFAYTETWWGTPPTLAIGGGATAVLEIPVALSGLANSQVLNVDAPFDGKIISINYRVITPVTTSAKAATLTGEIAGTATTGGVIGLTSANCTPAGALVSGSAVTGANTFTSGQAIGVTVSAVTTFVEGVGMIEITVQNNDVSGGTFTAPDTTSPATATTGDVRGTYAVPSASDGTKRLVVFETISAANISSAAGIFGVTQY
jgi:hypothetical protein